MEKILYILIIFSLGFIAFASFLKYRKYDIEDKKSVLKGALLGFWLVSTIFFGPRFGAIRVPGFFDITIERAVFIIVMTVIAYELFGRKRQIIKNLILETIMSWFLLICLVSMVFHGFLPRSPEYVSPWFIFINGYLFPFFVFLYSKYVITSLREVKVVFLFIFLSGLYLVLIAPLEFYGLRDFVYPQYINDKTIWLHLDRARGPFQNAAVNGLVIIYAFLCGMFLLSLKKGFWRVIQFICVPVFVSGIFFTQTRSVYLSFLLVSVCLILFYRMNVSKWRVFFLPICIFLLIAILSIPRLATEDRRKGGVLQLEEVFIRFGLIERSMAMIAEHPISGLGFGQFIPSSVERYKGVIPVPSGSFTQTQHNHLLGLAAELGILGVSIFCLIIGVFLFRASRALVTFYNQPDMTFSNLVLVLLLGNIAYIVNNMFIEPSYFITINALFYMFVGFTDRIYLETVTKYFQRQPQDSIIGLGNYDRRGYYV